MSLTRMIVLANSWKHHDWCLAGIEPESGRWIRPVTDLEDGRVPRSCMQLRGHFPHLLDIIELPLADTGPDFGFASENRLIEPGLWHLCGQAQPAAIAQYAKKTSVVLHNRQKYVSPDELKQKPFAERSTLELIQVDELRVHDGRKAETEKSQWKGVFSVSGSELEASLTDPVFSEKLNAGYQPTGRCLLTMSLGMPYKPPQWKENEQPVCWKLIAGVVEM